MNYTIDIVGSGIQWGVDDNSLAVNLVKAIKLSPERKVVVVEKPDRLRVACPCCLGETS